MILIDNYDSFTYNIVQYLRELGIEPDVYENDKISVEELKTKNFKSIILSPGAGNPDTAGICLDVIKEFYKTKKILGVCLGHQCIAQFFGASVVKAKEPFHGKVSRVFYNKDSILFNGLPQGFEVTRYHSLTVAPESVCGELIVTANTDDGVVMGIRHKNYPVYGVQFHPEAILSQYGHEIFAKFLSISILSNSFQSRLQ